MPKRKATFYGVRVGKQPGVYDNWEVCKIQVLGVPGSKYKGFQTRAEAENYVNDVLPCSQVSVVSSPVFNRTQARENLDETNGHYLPSAAASKWEMTHGCSDMVTVTMKETTPLKVSGPKEDVTSSSQASIEDPSQFYKLVEENGQQFVVFESLSKFDSYFEFLCRSKYSSTHVLESPSKNPKIRARNQSANAIQHIQSKVAMEDDQFVYFKDENNLKEFLEPYFDDAKKRAALQTSAYLPNLAAFGLCHGEQQGVAAERKPAEALVTEGVYQLEFDGASKGNPGRAGAGALIRCPHGSVVLELTEFLGSETNNVAEYQALIVGLRAALSNGIRRVRAQGDSKLVCLQVTGAWKVENNRLISLHKEVKLLEGQFEVFSIVHIRREYNSAADALANDAVNLGEPLREVVKPQPGCCVRSS
ncbi:hypothetical protein GOP47_0007497 [Adiantum capillus-veneris]|uniref:ribonuclease H n=1 Tax=Adiantum capillus-veneris TaxID=13818 RepID=A0A9D4V1P5_ADICA|nr:hypothetical protein GOP47_0007497 [Adiantum capillus-veneris]